VRTRRAQVLIARSYPDSFPGLRTSVIRTVSEPVELRCEKLAMERRFRTKPL
jgi:hypothetical protein